MLSLKIPPHFKYEVCRYTTCEMSSVLKATIENKMTSVTTHFKEINKEQHVYCLSYCLKKLSHPAGVALASCTDVCARTARRHTLPGTHRRRPTCGVRTSRSSSLTYGPQTARTWIQSIALFAVPFNRWFINVGDSRQSTSWSNHWVGQTVAASYWSRHWSVASPAWVGRPAARRTNWTFD